MILKWHRHAGGTGAAPGKYGWTTATAFGEYHISPVSTTYGRHKGYQTYFVNNKGKLSGGLWQSLGLLRSPNEAKGICKAHAVNKVAKKKRKLVS